MAISHAEFFRTLPAALRGLAYEVDGSKVTIGGGEHVLEITLSPQGERKLSGLLRLPTTDVRFSFTGYSTAEVEDFVAHFDRVYRRGGG